MKTILKFSMLLPFLATSISAQQIQNALSIPATQYDVIRVNGNTGPVPGSTLNRLGHIQYGTWNDGWSTWSSLGTPIQSAMGVTPNGQTYYGLTVNRSGDRAFFGGKRIDTNRVNAVIAWGDDDSTIANGNTDRLVFEFHNSNANPAIQNAMTLMPRGTNGVYAGIGTYGPTEQLHTTKGVRFAGITTGGSPNNLVAIDANGKLWRTSLSGGGSGIGNLCNSTSNPISGDYEIPLNSFNFHFSGDGPASDKVNVGIPCGIKFPGKLNVTTDFDTDQGGNNYSIYATNTNITNGTSNTGVYGSAISSGPGSGNNTNKGVWGFATGERDARGVFGQAGSSSMAYGGYFESINANGTNYGIYAEAANGITNWAGWFQGDVTVNGVGVIPGGAWTPSDERLKKEISELNKPLESLMKLKPKSYLYNLDNELGLKFYEKRQYGFLAQELEQVIPELVMESVVPARYDAKGNVLKKEQKYKTINYDGLISFLVKGIQEQQAHITQQDEAAMQQQKQIDELKSALQSLTGVNNNNNNVTGKITTVPVNLSDKNAIILNQNVPNPFAESTVITYNIPSGFTKAQILFSTADGKIIRSVDITDKGPGSLTVFANDLSHGIYTYRLVVDDKVIDSKKMIKQ